MGPTRSPTTTTILPLTHTAKRSTTSPTTTTTMSTRHGCLPLLRDTATTPTRTTSHKTCVLRTACISSRQKTAVLQRTESYKITEVYLNEVLPDAFADGACWRIRTEETKE